MTNLSRGSMSRSCCYCIKALMVAKIVFSLSRCQERSLMHFGWRDPVICLLTIFPNLFQSTNLSLLHQSSTTPPHQAINQCDVCDSWFHAKCCKLPSIYIDLLSRSSCIWLGPKCGRSNSKPYSSWFYQVL